MKDFRPLIQDEKHLKQIERGMRETNPILICWARSKEAFGNILQRFEYDEVGNLAWLDNQNWC